MLHTSAATPNRPKILLGTGSKDAGGSFPRWSADGKRLFYMTPQMKIVEVTVRRSPRISASPPEAVWDASGLRVVDGLEIAPDGNLVASNGVSGRGTCLDST
jgi:hypothetical protein